jgi:hypothetical protein
MLHLHSWRVGVPLYPKREIIRAEAPLPPHITETLGRLEISFDQTELSRV